MDKKTQDEQKMPILTASQYEELKRMLRTYIKVTALGAISEVSKNQVERNTWLLDVAGFSQDEIAKILHTSQATTSRILAGKGGKRKEGEEEQ